MLTICRKKASENAVTMLGAPEEGCWVRLFNPSEEEILKAAQEFKVPYEFLEHALDEGELPRVEIDGDNVLIVLRIPLEEIKDGKRRLITLPLGIIITKTLIVTTCLEESPILAEFMSAKTPVFSTNKRTRFLLQIFSKVSNKYIHHLNEIEAEIGKIEESLLTSFKNEEIIKLLSLERTIVYFDTAIVSNEKVIKKIMRGKVIPLFEEDQELLEDIVVESQQAIETVNIYSTILSNTMDAYASIISNNLNIVMKFLTSVTILLAIPSIIASFYGMNVPLPLNTSPFAFPLILLVSAALIAYVGRIFVEKKFF